MQSSHKITRKVAYSFWQYTDWSENLDWCSSSHDSVVYYNLYLQETDVKILLLSVWTFLTNRKINKKNVLPILIHQKIIFSKFGLIVLAVNIKPLDRLNFLHLGNTPDKSTRVPKDCRIETNILEKKKVKSCSGKSTLAAEKIESEKWTISY